MKNSLSLLCAAACVAIVMPALYAAQAGSQNPSQPAYSKHPQAQQPATQPQDSGERVFQRNCARCHATPEGFSSRISGTIIRHMRVRANLSERDERALLHFLNP
jgi:cytochrome c5